MNVENTLVKPCDENSTANARLTWETPQLEVLDLKITASGGESINESDSGALVS